MRNGSIIWGLILVILGGLLLAQNFGWLPANFNVWGVFWPMVLVFIGASMLLRASRRGESGSAPAEALRLPLDGASSARISLYHGAGELRVDDQAGPDELLSGSFGGGVEQRVTRSGGEAFVDLRVPSDRIPDMVPFDTQRLDWSIGLNPNIPLALNLEVGASHSVLNLTNLKVRDLRLQTGASATEIDLPAHAGATRATVRSGAASVSLRVPAGVAARIHASGGLASVEVDESRFPRISGSGVSGVGKGEYRSPDYETAENRLDVDIETGVGSVRVR